MQTKGNEFHIKYKKCSSVKSHYADRFHSTLHDHTQKRSAKQPVAMFTLARGAGLFPVGVAYRVWAWPILLLTLKRHISIHLLFEDC